MVAACVRHHGQFIPLGRGRDPHGNLDRGEEECTGAIGLRHSVQTATRSERGHVLQGATSATAGEEGILSRGSTTSAQSIPGRPNSFSVEGGGLTGNSRYWYLRAPPAAPEICYRHTALSAGNSPELAGRPQYEDNLAWQAAEGPGRQSQHTSH